MKVAVIGCGMMGAAHIRTVASLGAQPVAIDHNPERGAPHLSVEAAAAGKFHAAMICTPAVTHAAVAKELLRTGFNGPLFVEKPLATTPEETEVFGRWPHRTTMVGYMLRFDPMLRGIREQLGIWGASLSVHYDTSEWTASKYPMWRWLECSHDLDLALWLGAPAQDWTATPDGARIHSADGKWSVRVSAGKKKFSREWVLCGADNEIVVSSGIARMDPPPDDGGGFGRWMAHRMYRNMVEEFLNCAAAGAATSVPFSEGANVVDVLAAAGLHNVQDDSQLEA